MVINRQLKSVKFLEIYNQYLKLKLLSNFHYLIHYKYLLPIVYYLCQVSASNAGISQRKGFSCRSPRA